MHYNFDILYFLLFFFFSDHNGPLSNKLMVFISLMHCFHTGYCSDFCYNDHLCCPYLDWDGKESNRFRYGCPGMAYSLISFTLTVKILKKSPDIDNQINESVVLVDSMQKHDTCGCILYEVQTSI